MIENLVRQDGETPQTRHFDLKNKNKKQKKNKKQNKTNKTTFRTSLLQKRKMLKDLLLSGETHDTQPTSFC